MDGPAYFDFCGTSIDADPSHITTEFILAVEEAETPVFLDDVDLYGSDADSLYEIEDEEVNDDET